MHHGFMPTTQIRSWFGSKNRSAGRAQHQIGCDARCLHVIIVLDRRIVALVVLNTKLDAMHDDFSQTQIIS